jgi:ribosomal protein L27
MKNTIGFVSTMMMLVAGMCRAAWAEEITAVNFNGDLIGKVIPDGSVVSFDNEIIGNITADSLIMDPKGELLGGIVPQGIVIGNDNKLIGRVSNDGSVRLSSGKIVGKTLPNGLVVDDSYNILGVVLYPGLVYNDEGKTVGRLTGDGSYVSFEGQGIGFVSADGYAYRYNGVNYVLDGRLISSKIVINLRGNFLGSIVPGGQVTDSAAKEIGRIHANGYVYNAEQKVIGQAVSSGYAFDNSGKYLGLVSYNGEVLDKGKVVARLRGDDLIVNAQNEVIGFRLPLMATASDMSGKYLGRLIPNGQIVRTRESVGTVGALGKVYDSKGKQIGRVITTGPVFDYLGTLSAQSLSNGTVISLTGTPLGSMKGRFAFDNVGRLLGAAMPRVLAVDEADKLIGLSGIGSEVSDNGRKYTISPFGYVFSADHILSGHTVSLKALYAEDGRLIGYPLADGSLEGMPTEENLLLTQFARVVTPENKTYALPIDPLFATDQNGRMMGQLNQNNLVLNEKSKVVGKIVPEYKVVSDGSKTVMPVLGQAGHALQAIGMNGTFLGYANDDAQVTDSSGNVVGRVVGGNLVLNAQNSVVAQLTDLRGVVNNECSFLGVLGTKGKVRNSRDIVLGNPLLNGQAVSEVGNVIGHQVVPGAVINFDGAEFASVNALGQAVDYAHQNFGCLRWNGQLYNQEGALIGRRVEPAPVMDFDNRLVGRLLSTGEIVDQKGKNVGYAQPDDTFMSHRDQEEGIVFRYRFAFDNDNIFMGRVDESGNVLNAKDEVLGQVGYDGAVRLEKAVIGYALYDLYVYDDKGEAIGYLLSDGSVSAFSGARLGKADKGFLADRNYNLIGRGYRDYVVRDENHKALGELSFSGELIASDGSVLGKLANRGEIVDADGNVIATALDLQYYDIVRPEPPKPADWAGDQIKIEPVSVPESPETEEDTNKGFNFKAIGIALTPDGNYLGDILSNNDVVDKSGNLVGKKMPDGLVMDDDGNLIGIEEVKNTSADKMFVPAGTFGPGGAYGTGNVPINLGPGGGFGPGERYDPVRSQALAAAQAARRSEIAVGKLSTTISREDFDGKQDNWEGASFKLSSWRVDMSEMILADKPIPAVLARTIMSEASDVPVTAIVERNVYAEDGRNIVIPAGSRVIGENPSIGAQSGSSARVNITWKRLIRPDGSAFELASAQTGDAQGKAGALGYVDEQLLKKYSLPVAMSLLESGMAYVMADDSSSSSSSDSTSSKQDAANDARQNFLSQMDNVFEDILQNKLSIQAVTYVPAGTRIIIYPREDLWIRTVERSQKMAEGADNQRPEVLIDDDARKMAEGTGGGNGSSGGNTSGVVYEDDADVEPAETTPLIADDSTKKKKKSSQVNIPAVTTTGATPPPPSTNVTSTPAASDGTTPQLF